MHVVIFEGSAWKTFAPLSLSRPVFMLASGASTLLEKQIRHLRPTRLTLWVRPELAERCRQRIVPRMTIPTDINTPLDDEPALLVSGRTLQLQSFEFPNDPCIVADEFDRIHCACVTKPGLTQDDVMTRSPTWLSLLELPHTMPQGRMVNSLWDLIDWNEESLIDDVVQFKSLPRPRHAGPFNLINEEDVFLGDEVKLEPGVVIDASRGPVVVGDHARLGANSVIYGPCYIGPYVQVSPLTIIRAGVSIGMLSKVGGEISNSILLGYSNKVHDGFLGDSYIGKWVNLGAGTITSNLKNTYGEISVRVGQKEVPTGRRFLGSLIGDHAKTAIGTRLMTGSYIGFSSMIAISAHAPRFVPSFSYCTDRGVERYQMDKAIEVTRRVYQRRERVWTDTDEQIMQYVAHTAPEVEGGG